MIDSILKDQEVRFSYNNNYKKTQIESKLFLEFDIKLWDIIYLKHEKDNINKSWIQTFESASFISISKSPKKWHEEYWIQFFHNWPWCVLIKKDDFLIYWEWNLVTSIYQNHELNYNTFYEIISKHPKKINLKSKNISKDLNKHPTQKIRNVLEILYQVKWIQQSIDKQFTEQSFILVWIEQYLVNLSFIKLLECFDILSFSDWWDNVIERMKKVFNSLESSDKESLKIILKVFDYPHIEILDYDDKINLLIDIRNFSTHWWYQAFIPVKQRHHELNRDYVSFFNTKPNIYWYCEIRFHINTIEILYGIIKNLLLREIKKIDF